MQWGLACCSPLTLHPPLQQLLPHPVWHGGLARCGCRGAREWRHTSCIQPCTTTWVNHCLHKLLHMLQ